MIQLAHTEEESKRVVDKDILSCELKIFKCQWSFKKFDFSTKKMLLNAT